MPFEIRPLPACELVHHSQNPQRCAISKCHSSGYTGSPSLLMMQVSRCIQHSSTQQVELRTAIADALDDFQSIYLRFELPIWTNCQPHPITWMGSLSLRLPIPSIPYPDSSF